MMSFASVAQAQWPTLDIAAIKEGISSKIELVKQSKIVTETSQLAGKMNSTIGDAKASMSKFAGDAVQKAKEKAEKLQKTKERLEKNKEKLEKAKEKAEKAKEKYEKAQQKMNEAKAKVEKVQSDINEVKSEVTETVNEAKEIAADAKAQVDDAKAQVNDVKAQVNDVKSEVNAAKNLATDTVSSVQSQVEDVKTQVNDVKSEAQTYTGNNNQDNFVDDYVAAYEAGINSDDKIYEEVPATNVPQSSEATPPSTTEDNLPTESEGTEVAEEIQSQAAAKKGFRRPFSSKTGQERAKGTIEDVSNSSTATSPEGTSTEAKEEAQVKETTTTSETPLPQEEQQIKNQTQTEKTLINPNLKRGFRQRAIIKNTTTQDKGAGRLISEPVKLASYKSTTTLMFGAEESTDYIPDGVVNNGKYEETIIPASLVEYCNIGVDKLNDPTVMEECLKEIIRHQSDEDSQVAAEGKKVTNKIKAEDIIASVISSMQMKNIAANYQEEVADKFDEQASSSSTSRDDSATLAQSNKITQNLLNLMVTIMAAQVSQDALAQLEGLSADNLDTDEGGA